MWNYRVVDLFITYLLLPGLYVCADMELVEMLLMLLYTTIAIITLSPLTYNTGDTFEMTLFFSRRYHISFFSLDEDSCLEVV